LVAETFIMLRVRITALFAANVAILSIVFIMSVSMKGIERPFTNPSIHIILGALPLTAASHRPSRWSKGVLSR
jgi:hypothetical protein